MSITKEMKSGQHGETGLVEIVGAGGTDSHAPRKMTFAENLILTVKVLAGFGLLGAVLWGLKLWMSPN